MICRPIGSPAELNPQGTEIADRPARLTGTVKTSERYICRGSSVFSPILKAGVGVVGAMMTSTFFFMTPMMYLSGFVFPIENMPAAIQPLTYLIPLRYFVVILRGIFLKGVGLETLWPQALALFAWGAVILTLAVLRSNKRLA